MPKLTQWAEDNIPEGLTVFGLDLCEFNRKRLRASNMIERLNLCKLPSIPSISRSLKKPTRYYCPKTNKP
jgi:hypothetical protein